MALHSSQMGRGGHRDDRRRRLLAEDMMAIADHADQGAAAIISRNGQPNTHKSANYGDSEFLQTQLRLTDLIPRRLVVYFLLLTVGIIAIGGLIALYASIPRLLRDPQLRPTAFDLGSCGSLGNWFASLLLLMASLLASITYSVRQYKVDDYHGRYQVWLWAAGCWFAMATDLAASLHQGIQQVMISVTGTRIVGDGSIWWVVPAVLLIGSIGSRLLVDMWSSRLSSAALILAAIAYLTSLAALYHGIPAQSGVSELLLVQGSALSGHLLLAMSMGLHARYVVLDAEGLLHKRSPKRKEGKKKTEKKCVEKSTGKADESATANSAEPASAPTDCSDVDEPVETEQNSEDDESGDAWVALDPPHGGSQPVLKRVSPAPTAAVPPLAQKIAIAGNGGSPSNPATDDSKLSKADRKALKKKLIDERLKRERKAANW